MKLIKIICYSFIFLIFIISILFTYSCCVISSIDSKIEEERIKKLEKERGKRKY